MYSSSWPLLLDRGGNLCALTAAEEGGRGSSRNARADSNNRDPKFDGHMHEALHIALKALGTIGTTQDVDHVGLPLPPLGPPDRDVIEPTGHATLCSCCHPSRGRAVGREVKHSRPTRAGSGPTDGAGRCADVEGIGLLESSGAPSSSRECAVLYGLLNLLVLLSSSSRL